MDTKIKNGTEKICLSEDEEMEDPVGPMMHWEGDRSEEDRQFMSNLILSMKAEQVKNNAQSAGEAG